MKIRTLLIDDEALARALLQNFLKANPEFEVIGEAADGFEGIKLIQELNPDVIFLDIQMPKITGLELLELVPNPPIVVFSTAYDQYAIEAFEKNAIDYLLKPFSRERFLKTIEKVKEKMAAQQTSTSDVEHLLESHPNELKHQRLVIKDGSKIEIIPFDEISHLEAEGDYVWVYTAKTKYLKQKTLKAFEELFPDNFLRVHRSYLVNVSFIEKLDLYGKNTYQLLLKTGLKAEVSKNGYKALKEKLGW